MDGIKNLAGIPIFEELELSSFYDDERLIEDAITTPYEKVLKILSNLKNFIIFISSFNQTINEISSENTKELIDDLDWVINRIQSHTLYTYELIGEAEELHKYSDENPEIKSFLHFLNNYSEAKDIKKRNNLPNSDLTTDNANVQSHRDSNDDYKTSTYKGRKFVEKFSDKNLLQIQLLNNDNNKFEEKRIEKNSKYEKKSNKAEQEIEKVVTKLELNFTDNCSKIKRPNNGTTDISSKIDKNGTQSNNSPKHDSVNKINHLKFNSENLNNNNIIAITKSPADHGTSSTGKVTSSISSIRKLVKTETLNDLKASQLKMTSIKKIKVEEESNLLNKANNMNAEKFAVDVKSMMNPDFDIHEFDLKVGRNNVLPILGKTLLSTMGLMELINTDKLDNFLRKVASGYIETVLYHNSLHGGDVAQTICTFFLNSNLEEISLLNQYDILSMIIAALGHDIGHPGTNNGFQVNNYSEIAITYNDQSVLENFHCSTLCKIIKKDEFNIFDKFSDNTFKQIRKRIIGLILATDMTQHAKVVSILKPKVTEYKENSLKPFEEDKEKVTFITRTNFLFDDQQRLMDFIIHTADLSHNSKKFSICKKWTDCLMEEFWLQGDTEKQMGIPVSFLCDRMTADVPKSQIGFIRGIIAPTFELLTDLLPSLFYLRQNIDSNVEQWTKIIDETSGTTTPRNFNQINKTPRLIPFRSPNLTASSVFFKNNLASTINDPKKAGIYKSLFNEGSQSPRKKNK